MSAGAFTRTRYLADNGDTHPIRVQPETVAAGYGSTTNTAPTSAIDNPISARVSGGNRAFGLKPRSVTMVFETTAPTGYKLNSYIRIPILQPTLWNTIATGDSITYLGQTATVVGKSPERIR